MAYNFDEEHHSTYKNTAKWSMANEHFEEEDIIPLWVAEMDFKLPPEIIDRVKARVDEGIFGYTMLTEEVKEVVALWISKRHQMQVNQESVCFSPGVMPAVQASIQAFTNPGDRVIIQTPVYGPFSKVVANTSRELVTNPLQFKNGKYEMDFDDLVKKIEETDAKMLLLCNPHNPVGRVWSLDELQRLGEIVDKYRLLVVSDEIHADLILRDHQHTVFSKVSDTMSKKSVLCFSPSKSFNMAGLNTSFTIIEDEEMRATFQKKLEENYQAMANPISLEAAKSAYEIGEAWLEQCLNYIEGNIHYLREYLSKNIPELKLVNSQGTYLVWIDCRVLGLNQEELFHFLLKKAKVAVNNGFEFGEEGAGFIRMNMACRRATLEEALQRIEKAIKEFRK
ncbi:MULTISPECIES: MalY/PatB family protein [Bacillaceae]|uniref:cysteine-S-conjugate beta-lyase n=1 Tax=Evansella alkalicola TaxID=745819 RepID=A0ABS6JYB4_9BACI|nr:MULTISPECIES: MalY/PatB family protein [Bacillaceae]MBU9723594.1 pyridoxal phosphate-dependent aminotransferase [Bacillus alkalicola]